MDFAYSPKVQELRARLIAFMDEHIYPNEAAFLAEIEANRASGNAWVPTVIVAQLKEKARAAGLWNCSTAMRPTPATWKRWNAMPARN